MKQHIKHVLLAVACLVASATLLGGWFFVISSVNENPGYTEHPGFQAYNAASAIVFCGVLALGLCLHSVHPAILAVTGALATALTGHVWYEAMNKGLPHSTVLLVLACVLACMTLARFVRAVYVSTQNKG